MATRLLNIQGLTIQRDTTTLLQSIDWRVDQGEHWVILGSNGCGKTSLLKALTGYLKPSAGEIELLGARYGKSDWRDLRLRWASSRVRFKPVFRLTSPLSKRSSAVNRPSSICG